MKTLGKHFLQGILILLPVAITVYIVLWVFKILDTVGQVVLPWDIPGIGVLLSLVVILLAGYLGSSYFFETVMEKGEALLKKTPLIGKLYSAIKDTLQSLIGDKSSFNKVVCFERGGVKTLAFLTREECFLEGHVVLYVPFAFQMAGFTLVVPKEDITEVDMDTEEALRFMISAGIA